MAIRATVVIEWEPDLANYDEEVTNENEALVQEQKAFDEGDLSVEDLLELADSDDIKVTLEVV